MSQCFDCVYFNEDEDGISCKAYPEGVPHQILFDSGLPDWDGKCSKDYVFKEKE